MPTQVLDYLKYVGLILILGLVSLGWYSRNDRAQLIAQLAGLLFTAVITSLLLPVYRATLGKYMSNFHSDSNLLKRLRSWSWVIVIAVFLLGSLVIWPRFTHVVLKKYGTIVTARVQQVYYTAPDGIWGFEKVDEFSATTEVVKYHVPPSSAPGVIDTSHDATAPESRLDKQIRTKHTLQIRYLKALPFIADPEIKFQ